MAEEIRAPAKGALAVDAETVAVVVGHQAAHVELGAAVVVVVGPLVIEALDVAVLRPGRAGDGRRGGAGHRGGPFAVGRCSVHGVREGPGCTSPDPVL